MLRVHLTAMDLLKTRFASAPAPLAEVGLAVAALQRRDPHSAAGGGQLRCSCPLRPDRCSS